MAGSVDSPDSDDNDNDNDNDNDDIEDKELLKRLKQGQERMEQVLFKD